MPTRPDVLLFDLGGVLIDFAGVSELRRVLRTSATEAEVKTRWLACANSEAFGCGQVATDAFADRFLQEWQVPLTREAFLDVFRTWARGWLPGAESLLQTLRPHYRLAVLSNSNPVHWARLVDEFAIETQVEVALSSHQLGVRKPDPAIYQAALGRLGVAEPGRVLFFDDAAANVEAARTVGLQAAVVDGPEAIRRHLHSQGLWP